MSIQLPGRFMGKSCASSWCSFTLFPGLVLACIIRAHRPWYPLVAPEPPSHTGQSHCLVVSLTSAGANFSNITRNSFIGVLFLVFSGLFPDGSESDSSLSSKASAVFGSLHFLCQLASQNQHYLDSDSGLADSASIFGVGLPLLASAARDLPVSFLEPMQMSQELSDDSPFSSTCDDGSISRPEFASMLVLDGVDDDKLPGI
ncbi:hypothetical protein IMY05_016G0029000 [Salix suchowensis]|nr:hypothetical protein IMY05_016G0029000 [Salix suchowensis]